MKLARCHYIGVRHVCGASSSEQRAVRKQCLFLDKYCYQLLINRVHMDAPVQILFVQKGLLFVLGCSNKVALLSTFLEFVNWISTPFKKDTYLHIS
jgi:hypothetical protein